MRLCSLLKVLITWSACITGLTPFYALADSQTTHMRLTQPTIMRGAGSLGSYGISLGLSLHEPIIEGHRNQAFHQVTAQKGTPWPLDFGVTIGSSLRQNYVQYAGVIQYTLFEDLGLPSASIRGAYARTEEHTSQKDLVIDTQTIMGMAGYGFLNYFNAYAGLGLSRVQSTVTQLAENTDYYLSEGIILLENETTQKEALLLPFQLGLRCSLIATQMSFGFESQFINGKKTSHALQWQLLF